MKKTLLFCGSLLSIALTALAIYGIYQQSQLYPMLHQALGYQQCVTEVQPYLQNITPLENE